MISRTLVLAALLLQSVRIVPVLSAQATTEPGTGGFSLRFDNDVLARTDRCYTGGLALGWESGAILAPGEKPWLAWLPTARQPGSNAFLAVALGQKIYTPDDIRRAEVLRSDRPYAGVLFLTGGAAVRSGDQQRLFEVTLGLVGPSAGGESSQSFIHRVISGIDPQGWDNQLKNEPLLNVVFEHKWKALRLGGPERLGFEVIPHYTVGAGNLSVFAGVGAQARLGWRLPEDFGAQTVQPGGFRTTSPGDIRTPGFYLFASADGKAVGRNLLLDGNTFRESHSVDRSRITSDILLGAVLSLWRLSLEYEQVFWTRKFSTESRRQTFSSLSFRFAF